MTNRRSLVLALTAAALTPTVTFAAEAGDIFGGILQGITGTRPFQGICHIIDSHALHLPLLKSLHIILPTPDPLLSSFFVPG